MSSFEHAHFKAHEQTRYFTKGTCTRSIKDEYLSVRARLDNFVKFKSGVKLELELGSIINEFEFDRTFFESVVEQVL